MRLTTALMAVMKRIVITSYELLLRRNLARRMNFNVIQANVSPLTSPVIIIKIAWTPQMNMKTALVPALTMVAVLTLVSPHQEDLYANATLDSTPRM